MEIIPCPGHRTVSGVAGRAVARSSGSARSGSWGWAWTSGSGSVPGPRTGPTPKVEELHPDLAGGRAVAPGHLRPEAERAGGRAGRVQADRDLGPGPPDQRGAAEPGQGHGSGDADPQHDLARVGPRPGDAPPADRLSPFAGPGISGIRERGRQGSRGEAGDAPALRRGARCPDLGPERLPDAGL